MKHEINRTECRTTRPIASEARGKGGFTLLEMMVVVGIITIIVTLAIPTLQSATRSAKEAACIKGLKSMYDATQLYMRDLGYSPVQSSKPSSLFLRELLPYLPESYATYMGQNIIIKGYRLFGWVPDNPSSPTFPGVGSGSGSVGEPSNDRKGTQVWRIVAIPIEPYSGLRTFYLGINGTVSDTLDGKPI